MKNLVIFVSVFLLIGCATKPPQAFFAISENARQGGLQITAVNGEPISDQNGTYIESGSHSISAICRMPNGVGTSFSFEVELEPEYSYCFFSGNEGSSCRILYNKIAWESGTVVVCN